MRGCDSCEACDASAITSSCNAALMCPAAVFAYDQFRKDEDDYAELKDAPSKKAHSDPGEEYPLSMENRRDRMDSISVRDVLDKVERWRSNYSRTDTPPAKA